MDKNKINIEENLLFIELKNNRLRNERVDVIENKKIKEMLRKEKEMLFKKLKIKIKKN